MTWCLVPSLTLAGHAERFRKQMRGGLEQPFGQGYRVTSTHGVLGGNPGPAVHPQHVPSEDATRSMCSPLDASAVTWCRPCAVTRTGASVPSDPASGRLLLYAVMSTSGFVPSVVVRSRKGTADRRTWPHCSGHGRGPGLHGGRRGVLRRPTRRQARIRHWTKLDLSLDRWEMAEARRFITEWERTASHSRLRAPSSGLDGLHGGGE